MLLEGKKVLIFGVANNRSIAYGISEACRNEGARLAFSYMGDAIKKRIEPISEELGGEFNFLCDVSNDLQIADTVELVKEKWGQIDGLIHSVAFAHKEDLHGRFLDTTRTGFATALDISAYSLVALCKAFEPLFSPSASVLTLTYYGSEKVIPNYNVMGVAKAALEASVRYLATDLGPMGVRINAISAGPIKTLSSSGISEFRTILDQIEARAPMHRNVTIAEVGNMAAFLCSNRASAVTGDIIYVDCGVNTMGL